MKQVPPHMYPKDLVSYRNISNILEEAPICSTNWNLNYELRVTNYEVKSSAGIRPPVWNYLMYNGEP